MNDKILVTYATRTGSTQGVAEAIAKTLIENAHQVDLLPMEDVKDLRFYPAVVVGSAIKTASGCRKQCNFCKLTARR